MRDDDNLLDALGDALREPAPDIDQHRINALRAAVDDERHRAATTPARAPTTEPSIGRRVRWMPVAAAAAVLLVAVGAFVLLARDGSDDEGNVEYAGPITGIVGSGELTVVKTGIGRVVDLDTEALDILPTGEFYELWFVATDDTADSPNRISAGTFHPDPDGRSRVTFAAAVDPTEFPIVEVTAEPADGDPRPSGRAILSTDIGEG